MAPTWECTVFVQKTSPFVSSLLLSIECPPRVPGHDSNWEPILRQADTLSTKLRYSPAESFVKPLLSYATPLLSYATPLQSYTELPHIPSELSHIPTGLRHTLAELHRNPTELCHTLTKLRMSYITPFSVLYA